MRLAVLFVAGSMLIACGGDDAGPTGALTATVTHYDYSFDLATRRAHSIVTATVEMPGDCWVIPFRATEFDATTAKVDGKPAVSAQTNETQLQICGAGHDSGETLTIETDQTVAQATISTSQVGYSVTMDGNGNPFTYLVSWVGGCDKFGPCDSRPDQFATYTFHVTHPDTLAVSCPGTITDPSPTETVCDFTFDGGPTYSGFGFAAYPKAAWVAHDKGMWGSVHVTVYDPATTMISDAVSQTYNDGYVRWLESTFGPFPFGSELRVYTAPTYWSGFEHPGNIVLDDGLARTLQPPYVHNVQHILDHEIAHQWAGDQTTLADTYDFVWKESMAEYLAFAYEDMQEPLAAKGTASYWKRASAGAKFFPVPGEKPELFTYYGDVYGPGPMILFRQVAAMSSRDQVIAAIASVLGHPHAISVDDVVAALSAKTGLDLTAYAAAWIHGTGAPEWPVIDARFTAGTGTSMLHVTQTKATSRRCKFHIALEGAQTGDSQLVEVDTFKNGIDQTLSVPTPAFAVTKVTLDPNQECLVFSGTLGRERGVPQPWLTERAQRTLDGAARQ
jgi:aminopeptidase N